MINYQLNPDKTHANKIVNDVKTGMWCCIMEHPEFQAWLAEGNEPLPPDED